MGPIPTELMDEWVDEPTVECAVDFATLAALRDPDEWADTPTIVEEYATVTIVEDAS